ncbi:MAG: DNA replication/repair protein RecF [Oscillospiraceae bacterium]|nr:DNA replication/repair protein RecF [Oscillospiraceae bacterium]
MQINNLKLEHFRNYEALDIRFDEKCNVIYGENAQGKTNLLEAVLYLGCAKSPRSRSDKELISFGAEEGRVEGGVFSRERDFKVEIGLFRGKARKITVNGVRQKTAGDLSGILNTVYFCPDDLYLIRSGASERRRFMDISLCQLRPRYEKALTEYNRLYEHKTRILRDSDEKPDLLKSLPDFNLRMAEVGAVIIHYRARFVKSLAEYAAQAHFECSGGREELSLGYETVSTVEDPFASYEELVQSLLRHQESHYAAELASRLCLCGPHKDDLNVLIGGKSAKQFASQGQARTAALALKLSEREIHKNTTGEYPVLLLDDVLSELDPKRQEYVLNRIAGGQVFITCCEDDRLGEMMGGKVFEIENGRVKE